MNVNTDVVPDVLGPPYTRQDIVVSDRWDPLTVATLVRRPLPGSPRALMLWVHGFNDYFFHRHISEQLARQGIELYALDLRRYGRSIRPGHLVNFTAELTDYYTELDAAVNIMRATHPDAPLVLMGHSTGGLVCSLYARDRAPLNWIDGLVLNSPWLDMAEDDLLMTVLTNTVHATAAASPTTALPIPRRGVYSQTLHRTLHGEWDYDLDVKNPTTPPIRFGWLSAIRRGQARVIQGLDLNIPTLVIQAESSGQFRTITDQAFSSDVVLNVDIMHKRALTLGRNVVHHRVPDAMHDVFLSRYKPRQRSVEHVTEWLRSPNGLNLPL